MHKRLLSVAFGLSLALFATAASSRTYDFDRNTWSAELTAIAERLLRLTAIALPMPIGPRAARRQNLFRAAA